MMLSTREGWLMCGLNAVERLLERGIPRKQFNKIVRVLKLTYYQCHKLHAKEDYKKLEKIMLL